MSRTVAVTGATGFIGRHLVAELVARGIEVRAVVRPDSQRPIPPGVICVRAPLSARMLRDGFVGADTVIHLAASLSAPNPRSYHAVNVDGTRSVAEAARAAGAHLVYISSLAAAGPSPADAPRTEDDPPNPITPYGATKLGGERAVAETIGLRWTVLRPGLVYGPGNRAMLPLFRLAARPLVPLVGRRGAAYTFVHVRDVIRAITAASDAQPHREAMFVGHRRPVDARELLTTIQAAIGRRALIFPVPRGIGAVAAAIGEVAGRALGSPLPLNRSRYVELMADGFVCRVDRLRDRLGIEADIDLPAGIAETAAWYRREGWLR